MKFIKLLISILLVVGCDNILISQQEMTEIEHIVEISRLVSIRQNATLNDIRDMVMNQWRPDINYSDEDKKLNAMISELLQKAADEIGRPTTPFCLDEIKFGDFELVE